MDVVFEQNSKTKSVTITNKKKFKVGTIVISDRASKGEYKVDEGTRCLKGYFENNNDKYTLEVHTIIPDEEESIMTVYRNYMEKKLDLIITSGGTGLSPRDVTTITTKKFIDKEATGIETLILTESLKITKFASLSNPVVGIKSNTLIVTLPGSPKAIAENLSILEQILPHALNQIKNTEDFH